MERLPWNENWSFMKLPGKSIENLCDTKELNWENAVNIDVPHTWYRDDDPYRGLAAYRKIYKKNAGDADILLEFEGVEKQCRVFINGVPAGEHKGAYARFRIAVPKEAEKEEILEVIVLADNSTGETIAPLSGDFTVFGGIYRNVNLLFVNEAHFDYLFYGTDGIIVRTELRKADKGKGVIYAEPHVRTADAEKTKVRYRILDENNNVVCEKCGKAEESVELWVENPVLWNGMGNAHFYWIVAELYADGEKKDESCVRTGFCQLALNENTGLYLNGLHTVIRGVAMHQDFAEKYNAVGTKEIDKSFACIEEIGANAVRLSHYQHPQYTYDICDEKGYLVWAEIPMLKMTHNKLLFENACEQLKELIFQNIHHPCIFCWGIQNEIAMFREDEIIYEQCQKLSALVKSLDPKRYSCGANLYSVKPKSKMNEITDLTGYNLYFGWYYGQMEEYGEYLDKLHAAKPLMPFGISEYGVDANPSLHSDTPHVKDYTEEFQALFHETVYPILWEKEYLWGSFIWNMFDFHSAIRNEGGIRSRNAKGLVTWDREIKKDAFYYYKAKWSKEPFVHLCSKRFEKRHTDKIDIKVYTNQEYVALELNGTAAGIEKNNGNGTVIFPGIILKDKETRVKVSSSGMSDICCFQKVDKPEESYRLPEHETGGMVRNWFLSENDEIREGYYSVKDRADELLNCPGTREILEKYVPELVKIMTEKDVIPLGLEFQSILGRSLQDENKSEIIKSINTELNQIKNEEM